MALIGRDHEIDALKGAWQQVVGGSSRLVVVWGRRRVGKTFLLSEVTRGLPCVFFTATRNDVQAEQLHRLYESTQRGLGERAALAGGGFATLEDALRFFQQVSVGSPLAVVLDEVPRLASARSDLGDLINAVWESSPSGAQLMLVLCGSAVAAMRDLIGPEGGLYRRAEVELRIDPLDLWSSAQLLGPAAQPDAVIAAYAACGGYPLHLQAWDVTQSVAGNLAALAGSPGGLLLREALDIMFEDLDFRSGYERVLATIGGGSVRRGKIAGRAQQRIDYTLARLQRAGYVIAERPVGAPRTADPLYRLADTYLRFWFSVLREDAELVDGGQGQAVLRRVAPRWETHLQGVWEEIARAHAARLVHRGQLPADTIIGRWWRDEVVELDVVGLDTQNRAVLVGEAKWQSAPVEARQVRQLMRAAAHLPSMAPDTQFAVWSRHGVFGDTSVAVPGGVVVHTPATVLLE